MVLFIENLMLNISTNQMMKKLVYEFVHNGLGRVLGYFKCIFSLLCNIWKLLLCGD